MYVVDVGGWSYKLRGVSKVEGWWMRTDGARSCVMSVRLFADGCGWTALQSARCQRDGWPVDAGGWPYSLRGVSEVDGRRMRVDGLTICEMLARRMAGDAEGLCRRAVNRELSVNNNNNNQRQINSPQTTKTHFVHKVILIP